MYPNRQCGLVCSRYKAARQVDLDAQQCRPEEAALSILDALGPIALKAFGKVYACAYTRVGACAC